LYKSNVLIISNRKELSIKYKKLIEAIGQNVEYTNSLSNALSVIQKEEVEFIIISDTIKEKLSDFVRKIRVLTYNSRPIIIAVSKSGDLNDRLETLECGADDFLGEEISKQEFQIRFKAHLRRYLESSLNPITHLPDKILTTKTIKKTINNTFAYLLLKISGIEIYKETHGDIAYEKVLQTLGAIVNSTLAQEDFIGHISDNELILITNPYQSEKLASFLCFAFDNILSKFYSDFEFENNLTIQYSDEIQENKEGLMRLCVSVLEKTEQKNDYKVIINILNELIKLTNNSKKSTYVVDRIKLNGEVSEVQKNNKVLILEPDIALSCLLKNVCELNQIEVKNVFNEIEFYNVYESFKPNVVVLDWALDEKKSSLKIAQNISKDEIKLIFSSSELNKQEILKSGADVYLPKPYEIDDMLAWIKKFFNER